MAHGFSLESWFPTVVVKLSMLLHAIVLLALIPFPRLWPWTLGTMIAVHLVLFLICLIPRSGLFGPNMTRLDLEPGDPSVGLSFDDGPDPAVTPAVLEILERYGARASFFCIGERAEAHPELIRQIVDQGHRVENHTFRHVHGFAFLGPWSMGREIDRAQASLGRLAGRPPAYFRAPGGFRNPLLNGVLVSRGLKLVSWTRRGFDTFAKDPDRVVERLTRDLAAGDVLLLHDGSARRRRGGPSIVLSALPRLLDALKQRQLTPTFIPRPNSE
jgi:peptidoglycan/xylan/chitin deacetylase (PgdA/CDA1 family)